MNRRDFISRSLAGAGLTALNPAVARAASSAQKSGARNCTGDFSPSHYTRMFPRLERPPSTPNSEVENGLRDLGTQMIDANQDEEESNTDAGYTYLGQFIDHDLTLDLTPLHRAHPDAKCIPNFRRPILDLDNLYGGGPSGWPFLYEAHGDPGNERFVIGQTNAQSCEGPFFPASDDDLPRNQNGIALTGDPRQDENLIIAQLHVAFLKFHNCLMDELDKGAAGPVQSVGPAGGSIFDQARRLVTWTYQWLVVHDFLPKIIGSDAALALERQSRSRRVRSDRFEIPIEFSAAAFRFGHSMVRDAYFYNEHHLNIRLSCLMALTGAGYRKIPCRALVGCDLSSFVLPADWVIEWSRFFSTRTAVEMPMPQFNNALKINVGIAKGLRSVQPTTLKLFNVAVSNPHAELMPQEERILPVRTLWRGARMGLPTGQAIAKELNIRSPLGSDEIKQGPHEAILTNYHFDTDTPLWYYILKEAEVCRFGKGQRLGPVGGHIVGTVIFDALLNDADSYLRVYPQWCPDLTGLSITEMADLLRFVNSF